MGKTIVQQILAERSGRKSVEPGDYVFAKVDLAMANDLTGPIAIDEFRKSGREKVYDPAKIALIPDHFTPSRDIQAAINCQALRRFAEEQAIAHFYDVGRMGLAHNLLVEQGLVTAGDLAIGADSHSCTYGALGAFAIGVGSTDIAGAMVTGKCWFQVPETIRVYFRGELQPWVSAKDLALFLLRQIGVDGAHYQAIEYRGEAVRQLTQEGRFTLCNMAVEVGAKVGTIEPDKVTKDYLKGRSKRTPKFLESDKDATYMATLEYDATLIRPQITYPNGRGNVKDIQDAIHERIDQVFIGSSCNGWLEDLRSAAEVLMLARRPVHPKTRLIVIPATPAIYLQALREGVLQVFAEAGAAISTPTQGPLEGGFLGVLGPGERCLSTGSVNYPGCMGSPDAEVFLCNPAVAAASAILGRVGSPEEV